MPRILLVECMQEISSFNPLPSEYANFHIASGAEIPARHRGKNTAIGGALDVFDAEPDFEVVPVISASAGSGGILSATGWDRLSAEILSACRAADPARANGVYVSLHGAMGAENELDPEGVLLGAIRELVGSDVPIVVSLDLHGILTDRMIRQIDGLAIYHTYPHVDFGDTGSRAARLLVGALRHSRRPIVARVVIPALVRGDELKTKSGCYGELIRECQRLERDGTVLSAGIMIGNPFTDVPELCCQVVVLTDNDADIARAESERLANEFWPHRHRMQSNLISVDRAIAQARTISGPVGFTDAADATSSGASGDSNLILAALMDQDYNKNVLLQIVDASAAAAAHASGVGATIDVTLGGTIDPRFSPLAVRAQVTLLSDGNCRLETMKLPLEPGPTAVLQFANFTAVVMSASVSLFDRALYYASGLDPQHFDLVVIKSPHTEYHMYDEWLAANFNVDAPGSASANIASLGHVECRRPMYPMELDTKFGAEAALYHRHVD